MYRQILDDGARMLVAAMLAVSLAACNDVSGGVQKSANAAAAAGTSGGSTSASPTTSGTTTGAPTGTTSSTPTTANATGSVTLSWMAPNQNADGTALNDLAGYHVKYGTDQSNLTLFQDLPGSGQVSFQATNLAPGTWYFSIQAYNSKGEVGPAAVVSQSVS